MQGQSHHRVVHPRRARLTLPAAVLAVVLGLTGCGGGGGDRAAPTGTAAPTSTATSTEEPAPTTARPTATQKPTTAPRTSAPTTTRPHTPAPAPTTPKPSPTPSSTPAPSPTTPPSTPSPSAPRPAPDLVDAWWGLDIETFGTDRRVVALTFDGGASNTAVADILATLAEEGVPATFFVTGTFARTFPDSVRAMARAGHPVGNHSDTHPSFPQSTNEQIRAELAAAERSISALTGRTTQPLFRFPYGDRTPLDIEVVNLAGYIPIRWTVDTLGWQGTTEGISTVVVRQRVRDTARPGQVVLMHVGAHPQDGSTLDADALPGMIADLRALGYGFTTVPDLLAEGR